MSKIHSQFAKHLGKKILYKNKEYIVEGVWMSYLHCVDKKADKIALPIDECRIIIPNIRYLKNHKYSISICVYKEVRKYVPAIKSTEEIEKVIVKKLCECAKISHDVLFAVNKTRHHSQLYPRQILMATRNLLMGHTQANAASIFDLEHATTINSIKQVRNLIETDKEYVEKFKPVFDVIVKEFKYKAVKKLGLQKYYPDITK